MSNTVFLGIVIIALSFYIRSKVELDYKLMKELLYPILIGGMVLVGMRLMHSGLSLVVNYFVSMVISVVLGLVVYLIWVLFSKIFTRKEKNDFLIKRAKKIKSNTKSC